MFKQSAVFDYFQSKIRQRIEFDILAAGLVSDHACFVIDLDLVAVVDFLQSIGKFDDIKAAVDRVAIEDAGERSAR